MESPPPRSRVRANEFDWHSHGARVESDYVHLSPPSGGASKPH
jgi:hypothetical protein